MLGIEELLAKVKDLESIAKISVNAPVPILKIQGQERVVFQNKAYVELRQSFKEAADDFLMELSKLTSEGRPTEGSLKKELVFNSRNFDLTLVFEGDADTKVIFIQEKTESQGAVQLFGKISYLTALGDMVSGVTHEMNNALNVVKANGYFIERSLKKGDIKPAEGITRATKIQDTVDRMTNITKILRDLGRNPATLSRMITDFSVVATAAEDLLQWKLKGTGVEVSFQVEPKMTVYGNEPMLTQLLVTLAYQSTKLFKFPDQKKLIIKAESRDKNLLISIEQSSSQATTAEATQSQTTAVPSEVLPPIEQQVGYVRSMELVASLAGSMTMIVNGDSSCFEVLLPKQSASSETAA